jgi:hypothetical protein
MIDMSPTYRRVAGGLVAGAALMLGAAAPAFAAPGTGSGAMVTNVVNDCYTIEGQSFCLDQHEVQHYVTTASGLQIFTDNGYGEIRWYVDGKVVETDVSRGTTHYVYDPATDADQVDHGAGTYTATFADGTTCTVTSRYHIVDGRIQFLEPGGECIPS